MNPYNLFTINTQCGYVFTKEGLISSLILTSHFTSLHCKASTMDLICRRDILALCNFGRPQVTVPLNPLVQGQHCIYGTRATCLQLYHPVHKMYVKE